MLQDKGPVFAFSPSAEIAERLAYLEEGWCEASDLTYPLFAEYLRPFSFVRVRGLARFWSRRGREKDPLPFLNRLEQLAAGLHGAHRTLCYVVHGDGREVAVYLGTPGAAHERLVTTLQALFPGSSFEPTREEFLLEIDALPSCMKLLGIPSPPQRFSGQPSLMAVDTVIRGMIGCAAPWAYVVVAVPVPPDTTRRTYWQISDEIQHTSLQFFQQESTARYNTLVERYLQGLHALLEKLQRGKEVGAWAVETYYLGTRYQCVQMTALLQATLPGRRSRPTPIVTAPCRGPVPGLQPQHSQTTLLNSTDLSILVQLPQEEQPGYTVQDFARFDVVPPPVREELPTISLGEVQDIGRSTGVELRLNLADMPKHALVSGTTGSGKTMTCFHLLRQLRESCPPIPFLVIEPAKGEYQRLGVPNLKVYRLGDDSSDPLLINPFEVCGVPVQTHVDGLISLFEATFVLYPPMPYVLEQSLHEVYEDKGWDLSTGICWRGSTHPRAFPTLTDLYFKIEQLVSRLGYEERITMDVQAALQTRINSLRIGIKGAILDTRESLGMAELLGCPTVVDMKAIGNDEHKAFLIGLMLLRLYEYYAQTSPPTESLLQHVTVIEEAHRLLQNTYAARGGEDFADPRAKAIETFANILAEVRAYGEAVIIVEQIPTKLVSDVLKNTTTKMAHRMVAADDRAVLGATMGLDEAAGRAMLSLRDGEFLAFAERMDYPIRVRPQRPRISPEPRTTSGQSSVRTGRSWEMQLPDPARSWRAVTRVLAVQAEVRRAWRRHLLSVLAGASLTGTSGSEHLRTMLRHHAPVYVSDCEAERALFGDVLSSAADELVTWLGRYYGWSFEEEEEFLRGTARLVIPGFCGDETSTEAELEGFRDLCCGLFHRETLPYAACRICGHPCLYRLFLQEALTNRHLDRRFSEALELAESPWQGLAEASLAAAEHVMDSELPEEFYEAARCYLIQKLHGLGYGEGDVDRALANFDDYLADQTGGRGGGHRV